MTYSTKTNKNRSYFRGVSPQLKARKERTQPKELKNRTLLGIAAASAIVVIAFNKGGLHIPLVNHNKASADSQPGVTTMIVGDLINKESGVPYDTIGGYASLIADQESNDQGGGPVDSAEVAADLLAANPDLVATNPNLSVTKPLESGTPVNVVLAAESQAAKEILKDNQ